MTVKDLMHQPDWFCVKRGGERYRTSLHCIAGENFILSGRNQAGQEVVLSDDDEVPQYGYNAVTSATNKQAPLAT